MNDELKKTEDSRANLFQEETQFDSMRREGMYHLETMSKERTKRIKALSIKLLQKELTLYSTFPWDVFFLIMCFWGGIWTMKNAAPLTAD